MRNHFGTATNNSLQVQLNRRYINGLQFAVAYTLAKTTSNGTDFIPLRPQPAWNEAPDGTTQLHNLVLNYTWDVPNGSGMWNNAFTRGLLDGWQLSGDTAFVSGDWAGVTISTSDNFDFTGGEGGTGGDVGGGNRTVRPTISGDPICHSNCDPTPGGTGQLS